MSYKTTQLLEEGFKFLLERGPYTIRYEVRKNNNKHQDVKIFINNKEVMFVKNSVNLINSIYKTSINGKSITVFLVPLSLLNNCLIPLHIFQGTLQEVLGLLLQKEEVHSQVDAKV